MVSTPGGSAASPTRGSCLHRSYNSSAAISVCVLSPITFRLVSRRINPSMVRRQNRNAARSVDSYQRVAVECRGCRSQVIASHTLMSIKYEIIGRLGVRTERSATALALQQRQPHALALAKRLDRRDAGKRPAAFRDGDSLVGKILQQRKTPAAEIRDAEVGHISSVHQDVQLSPRNSQPGPGY